MALFRSERANYKPFQYPVFFDRYKQQAKFHWQPGDTVLDKDVAAWRSSTELTDIDRFVLENTQIYLASADTDICKNYSEKLLSELRLPEVRMMLLTYAAMECIHEESYSYTIDTIGFNPKVYSDFLVIPEMLEKHHFITEKRKENLSDVQKLILDLAINSVFGEGVQLFSAFYILLSYEGRGLMPGLCNLTAYIARDENFHCGGMSHVFNTLVSENKKSMTPELYAYIEQAGRKAVELEDHFIDLVFSKGDLINLKANELKDFVRFITNKRLEVVNLEPLFPEHTLNPLRWIEDILVAKTKVAFFERTNTEYQKEFGTGTWEEAEMAFWK